MPIQKVEPKWAHSRESLQYCTGSQLILSQVFFISWVVSNTEGTLWSVLPLIQVQLLSLMGWFLLLFFICVAVQTQPKLKFLFFIICWRVPLPHAFSGLWWFCWDFSFFCACWRLCTPAPGSLSIPDAPSGDGFVAPKFDWMRGIKLCNAWWFRSNTNGVVEGFGVKRRTPVCFGLLEPTESSLAFCCWDWQCQDRVHQGEEVTVAGVQTVDLGPVQSGKSLLPIPPAVHVCLEAGPLVVQLAHFKSWLDHRLEVLGQNQGVTGSKHSAHLQGLCHCQLSSKLLPCSLIWC